MLHIQNKQTHIDKSELDTEEKLRNKTVNIIKLNANLTTHVHDTRRQEKTGRVEHGAKTKSYVTNESKKDYPQAKDVKF